MTEAQLEAEVRLLLARLRLYGYHPYDARGSPRGWPDWVIVGTDVLFRELKDDHSRLRPEQRRVGYLLQAAGADWAVWRPEDLRAGRIAQELQAIVPPWARP